MEPRERYIQYGGWILSLFLVSTGFYFLYPRIHIDLLGIVLIYFGVRMFNFSTFDEYKEKRNNFLK